MEKLERNDSKKKILCQAKRRSYQKTSTNNLGTFSGRVSIRIRAKRFNVTSQNI